MLLNCLLRLLYFSPFICAFFLRCVMWDIRYERWPTMCVSGICQYAFRYFSVTLKGKHSNSSSYSTHNAPTLSQAKLTIISFLLAVHNHFCIRQKLQWWRQMRFLTFLTTIVINLSEAFWLVMWASDCIKIVRGDLFLY